MKTGHHHSGFEMIQSIKWSVLLLFCMTAVQAMTEAHRDPQMLGFFLGDALPAICLNFLLVLGVILPSGS